MKIKTTTTKLWIVNGTLVVSDNVIDAARIFTAHKPDEEIDFIRSFNHDGCNLAITKDRPYINWRMSNEIPNGEDFVLAIDKNGVVSCEKYSSLNEGVKWTYVKELIDSQEQTVHKNSPKNPLNFNYPNFSFPMCYEPDGFCANPQRDCINCPRLHYNSDNIITTTNTTINGTNTKND